jgi:mono/diheme cytochrome c family protein
MRKWIVAASCATLAGGSTALFAQQKAGDSPRNAAAPKAMSAAAKRGQYLVKIAGCNACHTAGYITTAGKIPEKDWLLGDTLGWRGPWGTTYAPNLRLGVQNMTEAQFVARVRSELRPPMPWFSMREMTDADVKAIYAYLKHVGPAGGPAPAYLPPDKTPPLPHFELRLPPPPPPGKGK